jgi:uncharacterized protein (DUF2344 family)
MKKDVVNAKYRIDLEMVGADDLVKMQTKLNQWITNQTLVKFDVSAVGDKMLFRVVRLREASIATGASTTLANESQEIPF